MIARLWHGWTKSGNAGAYELFDSIQAVQAFAGADYETAVVSPEARKLLARFDERSKHYEVVFEPR